MERQTFIRTIDPVPRDWDSLENKENNGWTPSFWAQVLYCRQKFVIPFFHLYHLVIKLNLTCMYKIASTFKQPIVLMQNVQCTVHMHM